MNGASCVQNNINLDALLRRASRRLDSRSFKRILAEQGIEPVGGLGLGDVDILFNTTARHSHIDYEGLCKIVRCDERQPCFPVGRRILSSYTLTSQSRE